MAATLPLYREAYRKWLDYERDSDYWGCVCAKADKSDGRLTLLSSLLSGGTVVTLSANLFSLPGQPVPAWLKVVVPATLALLSTVASHTNRHRGYAKKAATYQLIRSICIQQLNRWKDVLDGVYCDPQKITPDEALEHLRQIDQFVLVFEGTHRQDNEIALECERRARKKGAIFRANLSPSWGG